MKTDIIRITSSGENMDLALEQSAKVAQYYDLNQKDGLRLRLLTEEMMGLMRSITGDTDGDFWIENAEMVFNLHLQANTVINSAMREELLSTSTSGKNEAARSLMGRLREFFFRNANDDLASYQSPIMTAGLNGDGILPYSDWEWSLMRYQQSVSAQVKANDRTALDAWDELEKSVVSKVADDIKISIKEWQTEMIIVKKLG